MKRIVFLCFFSVLSLNGQKLRVACVGNSVTYGYGVNERENNSYPAKLQQLLGDSYLVENFGHSGATMLKNGHKPYWKTQEYEQSIQFSPNIVIIHLGLNDQGNNNWPEHKDEFIADYLDMISVYRNLASKPKIFICRMSPTLSGHHWFEEGMRENFKEIQMKIEEVSNAANVELIDLHEPLYRFPELLPDNIHPNNEGADIIAQRVYGAITGNYGGLQLPLLYGENMVLQRNQPITISGRANRNDDISVILNNSKAKTKVNTNGDWKVTLPAMKAGGPYKLSVSSKISDQVVIDSVYIGEVWLASGQSNMDFKVKDMEHASTVLKDSLDQDVFVFSLDPKVLKSEKFTNEELKLCNAENYFIASKWSNKKDAILENFSAVAYAYAYHLQKELNVPVGIICNAVGGSPTQSWISREQMESKHLTVDLLNDTWGNPMTHPWVAARKFENFGKSKKLPVPARHPYDPTFLFDAGILPLEKFNIKGVIWYQGESNAKQIDLHSELFSMLVRDWRKHWQKPDLPFYYVQLSSINRKTWGRFRDSQRKLLAIPNTGMVVSSDIGHPTDVHPKRKWIIGKRLSNIALTRTYGKAIPYSGPLLDYVNVNRDSLEVYFKFSEGLDTSDDNPVKDLQISGDNGVFFPAQAKITNDKLVVWSEKVRAPRYIRYGYTPYTDGNLVNRHSLPASTFSNEGDLGNLDIRSAPYQYSEHYLRRKAIFEASPDLEEEIIFLGNSITEGCEWEDWIPDKNVLNRGISGDVILGILNRLDEITSSKPNKVFLMIGTNDLARGKDVNYVLRGTRKIIEQILDKSESTTIYLQSILPINPNVGNMFLGHKSNHEKIIDANRGLEELSRLYNVQFIDLHKKMRNNQGFLKTKYTHDGLHLTDAGYVKWKNEINQYLK